MTAQPASGDTRQEAISSQRPKETDYGYAMRIIDTLGAEKIVRSVNHAEALAEALRWIKEVVNERKGTAHWLQMVEDKARNALNAYEEGNQ